MWSQIKQYLDPLDNEAWSIEGIYDSEVMGCTDPAADNYDPDADGCSDDPTDFSCCEYPLPECCDDPEALNYDSDCGPDDPCDDILDYTGLSEDIFVVKSTDGGHTWFNPLNATNTVDDPEDYPTSWHGECQGGLLWCGPEENYPHAAHWSTEDEVYYMFQMPNWGFNEIGDLLGPDHMNRVYSGKITTGEFIFNANEGKKELPCRIFSKEGCRVGRDDHRICCHVDSCFGGRLRLWTGTRRVC